MLNIDFCNCSPIIPRRKLLGMMGEQLPLSLDKGHESSFNKIVQIQTIILI